MKNLESDNEIIKKIKQGIKTSENYKIISERHSALFYKMASKYISKKFKEKRLDFFKDKDYYIFQIILDYDSNKNTKFSTYLANRIKWMCMNDYNKHLNCCEVNCPDDVLQNCQEDSKKDYSQITEVLDMLKKEKDSRVLKIFQLRYLEGKENNLMPWKDVCCDEEINLSVQGCINVHNKYLKKIGKGK